MTALGDHALAPGAAGVPGEEIAITCGAPGEETAWDNRRLEALTLPPAMTRIGDYAFLNCAALKALTLHDTIRQWGGGTLMNCRCLDTFHLTRTGEEGEALAAAEIQGRLNERAVALLSARPMSRRELVDKLSAPARRRKRRMVRRPGRGLHRRRGSRAGRRLAGGAGTAQ